MANEVLPFSMQAFLGALLRHKQLGISWRGHKEKIVVTNLSMKLSSTGGCCNQILPYFIPDTVLQFMEYQDSFPQQIQGRKGKISDSTHKPQPKSNGTR